MPQDDQITPPPGFVPVQAQDSQVQAPPGFVPLNNGQAPITTTGGLLPTVARGALDAFEGVGSGVANSVTGLRDLANKGTKALGMGELPDVPAVLREAGTTPPDASMLFKAGRVGEQVGEFFVPGTELGTVGKAANFGGKMGHAAEFAARTATEAAAAGLHAGVQSHGDTDTMRDAALTAGLVSAPFSGVNAALKMVKPTTLYAPESLMPFIEDRFKKGTRFEDIIGQAIDNNINISRAGLARAQSLHGVQTAARDSVIAGHAGDLVDNTTVYSPLRDLQALAARFGEPSVVKSIDKRIAAVEASHGGMPAVPPGTVTLPPVNPKATLTPAGMPRTINTPGIPAVPGKITVDEAQELKNFGQSMASKLYAQTGESVGAQRVRMDLSEGFMKAIEDVVPEVKGMNQNLQNTKIIRNAIEDYISSNPSLVNMRTLVWATVAPKSAGVALLALPRVRSALAIAAHSNKISNVGASLDRLAAGTSTQMLAPDVPQMPVGVK